MELTLLKASLKAKNKTKIKLIILRITVSYTTGSTCMNTAQIDGTVSYLTKYCTAPLIDDS